MDELKVLGSPNPVLRQDPVAKAGPLKTDQGFLIVDAPFPALLLPSDIAAGKKAEGGVWEVEALANAINAITGVLEVGLFCGPNGPQAQANGRAGGQKPVAAYFGNTDGTVISKRKK